MRELDNWWKRIIYGHDDRHDIHFMVFIVYFEKFIFCTVFKRGTNMKFDILPSTFVMEDKLTTYTWILLPMWYIHVQVKKKLLYKVDFTTEQFFSSMQ